MKYHLFVIFICLSFTSCAITSKTHHYTGTRHNNQGVGRVAKSNDIKQDNTGIIYGNIQTNSRLKDIEINKILPNGKVDYKSNIRVRTFSNGNFIVENLKHGNYIISSIDTRSNTFDLFATENDVEFYSIQVYSGEAVYAGTYKILTTKKNGTKKKDNVVILRSAIPTEKKILRHVSKVERNTLWLRLLKARMRKLI